MHYIVQPCVLILSLQATLFAIDTEINQSESRVLAVTAPAKLLANTPSAVQVDSHEIVDISEEEWTNLLGITCPPLKQANVEVILAADHTAAYGSDVAYGRAITIMIAANACYLQNDNPSFALRLTRIHRFIGTDPFSPSTDMLTFLDSVAAWSNANINSPSVGCVIAFSARLFNSGVVGSGYSGTACQLFRACVARDRPASCNSFPALAAIAAQSMGRTWGMGTDPQPNYIMSSVLNCSSPPTIFSAFSQSQLGTFLAGASTACVVNNAGYRKGDMNCDCAVLPNEADLGPFVQSLLDPDGYQSQNPGCSLLNGDMNSDGLVDGLDVGLFVKALMP